MYICIWITLVNNIFEVCLCDIFVLVSFLVCFYWSIVYVHEYTKICYSFVWYQPCFSRFDSWSLNPQCMFQHRSFAFTYIFLIQVNNCLDKEFQGYRVVYNKALKKYSPRVFQMVVSFHILPSNSKALRLCLPLLFFNGLFHLLLLIEHLGHLSFALISITLMTNDSGQLFLFLSTIYISSFFKCVVQVF